MKPFLVAMLSVCLVGCATAAKNLPEAPPAVRTTTILSLQEKPAKTKAPRVAITMPAHPIASPIDRVAERAVKITKSFGKHVTPDDSSFPPERFNGYHTGTDFEAFPSEEATAKVWVYAACTGSIVGKEWASGYGGVVIQRCKLDGKRVTVLYGHLRIQSVMASKGATLYPGDRIGILGKGYSHETDGERKHLHFAIHKSWNIELRGYVPDPADLSGWIDPMKYLSYIPE
jgi:murein DD-endopeptidase MepM/ murein hydrolase activator NlpD